MFTINTRLNRKMCCWLPAEGGVPSSTETVKMKKKRKEKTSHAFTNATVHRKREGEKGGAERKRDTDSTRFVFGDLL